MIPETCLQDLVQAHKTGQTPGIYSICSSNPFVIQAALQLAKRSGTRVLIESTSNQVNQFGGYMGSTPVQFYRALREQASRAGLENGQLMLGGDHLGPNAWQNEPAGSAMPKALKLVSDYVSAGYTKIHLDASMRLEDDPPGPLAPEICATRAAQLAKSAEMAWQSRPGSLPPCYIIGTEVPIPGGALEETGELEVTPVENARYTVQVTQQAFRQHGLEQAWERVVALVVQPGVEFGDAVVYPYQPDRAAGLARWIESQPGLIYEAHSTDYQTPDALRQLVRDHFAILKVGPALTFAFREAVFALELIEQELLAGQPAADRSCLQETLEQEMVAHPQDWQKYYHGSPEEQRLARRFSLSDRVRYYWTRPPVEAALQRLLTNLSGRDLPLTLVSQYFPAQFRRVQEAALHPRPLDLVYDKIQSVLLDYQFASTSDKLN